MIRLSIIIVAVGILLGLGIGILFGWVIAPVKYIDTDPATLRADYKDEYLILIASSYAADHNLDRARQRLATLGYPDPVQAVDALAQRLADEGKDSSVLAIFVADLRARQATVTTNGSQADTSTGWERFEGTGYSLVYPAEWYVYQGAADAPDSSEIHYDLILSDAPDNHSPEHTMNNEQARIMVWYVTKRLSQN